jgi:hypothetical protein
MDRYSLGRASRLRATESRRHVMFVDFAGTAIRVLAEMLQNKPRVQSYSRKFLCPDTEFASQKILRNRTAHSCETY